MTSIYGAPYPVHYIENEHRKRVVRIRGKSKGICQRRFKLFGVWEGTNEGFVQPSPPLPTGIHLRKKYELGKLQIRNESEANRNKYREIIGHQSSSLVEERDRRFVKRGLELFLLGAKKNATKLPFAASSTQI